MHVNAFEVKAVMCMGTFLARKVENDTALLELCNQRFLLLLRVLVLGDQRQPSENLDGNQCGG